MSAYWESLRGLERKGSNASSKASARDSITMAASPKRGSLKGSAGRNSFGKDSAGRSSFRASYTRTSISGNNQINPFTNSDMMFMDPPDFSNMFSFFTLKQSMKMRRVAKVFHDSISIYSKRPYEERLLRINALESDPKFISQSEYVMGEL
jgi:hypothetical protein